MKKQFSIRSLAMLVMFTLLSFTGFSQVATKAAQDTSNAKLALIKNASYSNSVTLISIKKSNDTLAQSLRLTGTAANQVISTASLALIKKSNDTISQSLRLQATAANQVISTASLALIKKSNDTLAQSLRVSAANQVINTATATLVKKSSDTLNQSLRSIVRANAIVTSAVVMSVAGAYATGEYMGTTTTPQSFANCVRSSGATGNINSLFLSDKITDVNVAMELWIFSATFTAPTDNQAWTIGDDDALLVQAVIPIASNGWFASGANQIYFVGGLNIPIKPAATSLFYALVARGSTPAFTSSDITIGLGINKN